MNGYIETSQGKVHIPSICVEEEAAKKNRDKTTDSEVYYRLDRLGVCLVEIATDPEIKNAEHAKECAEKLGMILRSTGKVKRGIGTIRQDVNVSIKGGVRVEIKGFQDLKSIPQVVDFEIHRQLAAIEKGEKLVKEVRKAEPDMTTSFLRPMPGAARLYPETDVLPIPVDIAWFDSLEVPELLSEKKNTLIKEYKLDQGIVKDLLSAGIDFESYVKEFSNIEAKFIATVLVQVPKELKRKDNLDVSVLTESDYKEFLGYLNENKVPKDAVSQLLVKRVKGETINLDDFKGVDDSEIEAAVTELVKEKPGLNIGGYMGLVMAKFKGKVDGKKVSEILKKVIN